MANIKQAKKRIKVNAKRNLRNKIVKSRTRTEIRKFIALVESGNKAEAEVALKSAQKQIDMAYSKGVFHKNNAARKKSRLAKMVNKIA